MSYAPCGVPSPITGQWISKYMYMKLLEWFELPTVHSLMSFETLDAEQEYLVTSGIIRTEGDAKNFFPN